MRKTQRAAAAKLEVVTEELPCGCRVGLPGGEYRWMIQVPCASISRNHIRLNELLHDHWILTHPQRQEYIEIEAELRRHVAIQRRVKRRREYADGGC